MKKKIIDGVVYDTTKAESIASHSEHLHGDFYHFEEALYRTKKGSWFLRGSGGAASKYANHDGNSSYGSSDIVPLTDSGAQSWLEQHDHTEEVEKYFQKNLVEA